MLSSSVSPRMRSRHIIIIVPLFANVRNTSSFYSFKAVLSSRAFYLCSHKSKRVGFGETPNPEDGVSLQGDRTTRNGQNGLSPVVCGPQCPGITSPYSLELKNVVFSG